MSTEPDKDLEILAAYTPRAFAIELLSDVFDKPSKAKPNAIQFDSHTFPIFMHELAHLVQDRSTFRGIMEYLDLWDQMEVVAAYSRAQDIHVDLPIIDPESRQSRLPEDWNWGIEVAALRQYREPKRAWTCDRFWAYKSYSVVFRPLTLAGRKMNYPTVTVHLVDNVTGESYDHTLGSWEIKEAYSVAVGLLHGGEEKQPADWFEYLVVERILTYYFGQVSPEQTIAFCHWALQDLAPANTLFTLIEIVADIQDGLPEAETIYDLGRLEANTREWESNCLSTIGMLQELEESWHGHESIVALMLGWFRRHAEMLLKIQLDPNRRFPIDTFLCKPSEELSERERDSKLNKLFEEVEVPLIVWPDGSLYSINHSTEAIDAVLLNRCVFDLFTHMWTETTREWPCPIYEGCPLSMKDDNICRTKPWEKNRIRPTCPYGVAAAILGISPEKQLQFVLFAQPS